MPYSLFTCNHKLKNTRLHCDAEEMFIGKMINNGENNCLFMKAISQGRVYTMVIWSYKTGCYGLTWKIVIISTYICCPRLLLAQLHIFVSNISNPVYPIPSISTQRCLMAVIISQRLATNVCRVVLLLPSATFCVYRNSKPGTSSQDSAWQWERQLLSCTADIIISLNSCAAIFDTCLYLVLTLNGVRFLTDRLSGSRE